jgi:hypothetical protein
VNQWIYANFPPFILLQLALTIVYIAAGVFAAGWIGIILCIEINHEKCLIRYFILFSCHTNAVFSLFNRGFMLDFDWRTTNCCHQVQICPSIAKSGYEFF